jgi:hypothetical protein
MILAARAPSSQLMDGLPSVTAGADCSNCGNLLGNRFRVVVTGHENQTRQRYRDNRAIAHAIEPRIGFVVESLNFSHRLLIHFGNFTMLKVIK